MLISDSLLALFLIALLCVIGRWSDVDVA